MSSNLSWLKDKTILVTGGTGSFGRTLIRKLLNESECKKVIVFSRDEWKQWEMQQNETIFTDKRLRYFLGDVRDEQRLRRAFNGVHYVVHTAALKQVPAAEYNPSEFVQTNVMGAMNIINAAIDSQVEKVVALSTDKAVNPVNLYGATKLCSDKLFTHGNVYVGPQGFPQFSVVRYGNVLGSRGSIIPLWKKMIKEGIKALPVTDPRMTRFWITLDQAVEFVIDSFVNMIGGEIFIPKIPSMRITDLAKAVAPDIPQNICGIREGEKLHELMINSDDSRNTLEFEKHYTILPETNYDQAGDVYSSIRKCGKILPEGFSYTSDNNTQWIKEDELSSLISTIV